VSDLSEPSPAIITQKERGYSMSVSEKPPDENVAALNESKDELHRPEAGGAAEPEVLSAGAAKLETSLASPKKRGSLLWWIVLLLALTLAVVGYLQRERLLKMILSRDAGQSSAPSGESRKILYWVDPMHPAYKADKPGKAPDCGMDLVPVYAEGTAQTTAGNLPEGVFQVTPEKQQLIGVQYCEAVYKPVFKTLRTVGRLAYDETKIAHVHSKVEGWIEQVFVDFTGKEVRKGQPLISIYSPELWQTQQEYLLALKGRNELAVSPFREAVTGSESLLQAARKRLELWDISEEQIQQIEQIGKPIKAMMMHAPSDGFVLTRKAFLKLRVTPETELYTLADLSTIWVIAEIYEYEAPEIRTGQSAAVTLSYSPGRTFRGKVSYIYPQLDAATRTLKVRIEVPNPGFALKPEMYANVELRIDYGRRVVVPQEAVIDSGAEQMVFVAHEGGYFEPRKVTIGAKVGSEVIVLNGLKSGERVVTSANFLIDSESKLKSAAGGMGMPGMSHGGGTHATGKPSPPAEHSQQQQADHSQHRSKEEKKKP
jgi:membrane fusion protein, copper/silver efflux system